MLFTLSGSRYVRGNCMPTLKSQIQVVFEDSTASVLTQLASQEQKTVGDLVRELTLEALEKREDFYLSKLAEKLDQPDVKTYSHDEAWK
jgi:predicted DNA-binding protein